MKQQEPAITPLSQSVSAAFRALLAARKLTAVGVAPSIGRSLNYVATRLRGDAPFTVDDVEGLLAGIDPSIDAATWILDASRQYKADYVWPDRYGGLSVVPAWAQEEAARDEPGVKPPRGTVGPDDHA